jgi:hypothetical protein
VTVSRLLPVGTLLIFVVAWDNTDTTDGNPTRLSVVDNAGGNTFTRLREFVNGQGSVAAGAHVGVFYSILAVQRDVLDGFNCNSDTARTAKAAHVYAFSVGSGVTSLAIDGATDLANDGADPGSMSLSSLPSAHRLYIRAIAREGDEQTGTATDGTWTLVGGEATSGGSAVTNMGVLMEWKIATSTGETSDPAGGLGGASVNRDHASVLLALSEVFPAKEPYRSPYAQVLR